VDDVEEQEEWLKQAYIRIAEAKPRQDTYFPKRFYDRETRKWREVEILPSL
jgi:hypothetical protein